MYRRCSAGRYTDRKSFFGKFFRGLYAPAEIGGQASRMAVTPCPPAAQMEIRPRTG